jgi:hypothetical protein
MIPSVTEAQVLTALGNLLTVLLPQLTPSNIIIGQVNRVASPEGDYVVMWPLNRPRLGTNFEEPEDCKFTASIAADQMTVTGLFSGEIEAGNQVFGLGIANNTVVQSQSGGTPGGIGIYLVTPAQTVTSETMSAGTLSIATSTEFIAQLDVHGPNSGDNAQVISNAIRSEFAVNQMAGTGVTPLFSDDPRQAVFETAAKQFDERWTVDVHLQITPSISTPQEFYDAVDLTLVDVDVVYPD